MKVLSIVAEDQFLPTRGDPVPLDETSYLLSALTAESLERLANFMGDLTRRYPLSTPTWTAHREALQAFESDLRRELVKRE
jgi:hypothetical protein